MANESVTDCRSKEGITTGLIDGVIAAARVIRDSSISHPAIVEALRDIADDEDVAWLVSVGKVEQK